MTKEDHAKRHEELPLAKTSGFISSADLYEAYRQEYTRRYGDSGPSESSDCGGTNGPICGCWVCRCLKWKLVKDQQSIEV